MRHLSTLCCVGNTPNANMPQCHRSFKLRRLESTDQYGNSAHLLLTEVARGLSFTHPILSSCPAPSSPSSWFRYHRVTAYPVAILWVCLINLKTFFFFFPFPSLLCILLHALFSIRQGLIYCLCIKGCQVNLLVLPAPLRCVASCAAVWLVGQEDLSVHCVPQLLFFQVKSGICLNHLEALVRLSSVIITCAEIGLSDAHAEGMFLQLGLHAYTVLSWIAKR